MLDHRTVGLRGGPTSEVTARWPAARILFEFAGSRAHIRKSSLTILRGPPSREVVQFGFYGSFKPVQLPQGLKALVDQLPAAGDVRVDLALALVVAAAGTVEHAPWNNG